VSWPLALDELFGSLLWGMLFVVGAKGSLSGIGLACVWGVILWLVVW
jgi:hypothetical protein